MRLVRIFYLMGAGLGAGMWASSANAAQGLQDLASRQSLETTDAKIALININPAINRWFILEMQELGSSQSTRYHLESVNPHQTLSLSERGIRISLASKHARKRHCLLWGDKRHHIANIDLNSYQNPFFPLCEGLLYLRLRRSSNTKLSLTEWGSELLRKTDFGEDVISLIKPMLVSMGAETTKMRYLKPPPPTDSLIRSKRKPCSPRAAAVQLQNSHTPVGTPEQLGINLASTKPHLTYGQWYPARLHPGVFVSVFLPGLIAKDILAQNQEHVFPLPTAELDKMVYILSYDLQQYSLAYAVGTTEPPIITSQGAYGDEASMRQSLVAIGSIPPYALRAGVGVFIGGFKQRHGTFKVGTHRGKSNGYIESGVELAPMAAGLATVIADHQGEVAIENWPSSPKEVRQLRAKVVSARQNGTLLVEDGVPGPLVNKWQEGNWSADAKGLRQSLRSGLCVQESKEGRHLLFMAFTAATPSTMARVMQAYHCSNGLHLDMNAYMYLHQALYTIGEANAIAVEYLHKDMLYPPKLKRHRFIMDNNNRDFFYVHHRKPAPRDKRKESSAALGTSKGPSG